MGIFLCFVAAVLSTGKDLISKRLAFTLNGTHSAYASFLYALPCYIVVLFVLWLLGLETFAMTAPFFGLVILRSLTDAGAEATKMHALGHGDLSAVAPVLSLSPVFLLFTSPLITGDKVGLAGAAGVILCVIGTLAIVYRRPARQGSEVSTKAILIALASSFFFSLNACFDRLAVQIASPTFSGFAMTLVACVFLYPLARRHGALGPALRAHTKPLWGRGVLEVCFMIGKLAALQYLQAPYVAAIMKSSILFSVVAGRLVLKETEFKRRLLASVLIILGIAVIVLEEIL